MNGNGVLHFRREGFPWQGEEGVCAVYACSHQHQHTAHCTLHTSTLVCSHHHQGARQTSTASRWLCSHSDSSSTSTAGHWVVEVTLDPIWLQFNFHTTLVTKIHTTQFEYECRSVCRRVSNVLSYLISIVYCLSYQVSYFKAENFTINYKKIGQ